jgi:hypothetical protein
MLVRWRSGDEEREHAGIQISRKGRSLAVLQHPGVAQILVRRGPRGCCGLAHCSQGAQRQVYNVVFLYILLDERLSIMPVSNGHHNSTT